MKNLRLAYVGVCDFRRSEVSNYADTVATYRKMKTGETFLFVSKNGNQLMWMLKVGDVVDSRRWRLPAHRTWHPWMISEYARSCGLNIDVRSFESYLTKRLAA